MVIEESADDVWRRGTDSLMVRNRSGLKMICIIKESLVQRIYDMRYSCSHARVEIKGRPIKHMCHRPYQKQSKGGVVGNALKSILV